MRYNAVLGARRWLVNQVKKRTSGMEIASYIRKTDGPLRLNIGAQVNKPRGWLSVDIMPGIRGVYLDATDMSAVPDDAFDAVLCEHMIEHVGNLEGLAVMRSVHRILKPGGVARFVTPDLERLVKAVNDPAALERDIELFRGTFAPLPIGQKYPAFSGVDYINIMFREWGHQYLYTPDDLTRKLEMAGFSTLTRTLANNVSSPLFEGAQARGDNNLDAFAIEVTI